MYKNIIFIITLFLSFSATAQNVLAENPLTQFKKIDGGQDWYETFLISENTYAISAPNHWQQTISYLLIGDEKALLVDTGMAIGNIKHTVDALTSLPVIVINTHSHYDHVSNNHHFETIYGRDLEFTTKNSSGHPKAIWQNAIQPSAMKKNLPKDFSYDEYQSKSYKITKFVNDNEIIDLGNRNVEVIYTPGHTPDSIFLFDHKESLLMTGDTFYPSTLWAHRADADFKDYIASAKKMMEMEKDVKHILPGHGNSIVSPTYLTKLYEAFLAMRSPDTPYKAEENRRRYQFDGFAALVKDPPE